MRSETPHSRTDPDELRDLHLRKLRAGLAEVLKTNAFWRSRLSEVRGWDDFERLPLTAKDDLLADQAARPPYGTNLTYPLDRYVRIHQTSGSSGDRPLRWLDTEDSWDWWERIWAEHVYPAAGVEAFAGPIGLRLEAGDDVYFHSGAHNNLRVTIGPQFRF